MIIAAPFLAAPSPDLTVGWGTAAPALGLLIVAIAFNIANQRTQRRDIRELKRENVLCNYRQLVLVQTLNAHSIAMPENFWTPPPEGVAEMNIAEQFGEGHRRRLGRFDLFSTDDDEGQAEWRFLATIVALILLATVVVGGVMNCSPIATDTARVASAISCRSAVPTLPTPAPARAAPRVARTTRRPPCRPAARRAPPPRSQ